ncbi:hypothetical protein [Labrys monachus]|uniref:Uncharacterized protein n=1 Tax=Labrys monachus TaxID=217067 RepID=A0ABU0FIT7_9HYPH|nr:hypothetical protein [Labrys monachus]MDQ0394526.1 hypothetical protein [Labrys monachus]
MKIIVEFYRTREADDAHAVLGRVTDEAHDLDDAIDLGRRLALTLDMPQRPDAMTITAAEGGTLYSGVLDAAPPKKGKPTS